MGFLFWDQMLTFRLGILFSTSGDYAALGRDCRDGAVTAIEDLQATASVVIEPVAGDPAGLGERYIELARRMVQQDGCRHIIGTVTSQARKDVIPVVEKHDAQLWYVCPYEGFEASPNVIYAGACPNQHLLPLIEHMLPAFGRRVYLAGANYVWGWEMNRLAREIVTKSDGRIVGERYLPIGDTEVDRMVAEIAACRPDFILSNMIGPSNHAFLRAMRELGERDPGFRPDRCPVASCDLTECELPEIGIGVADGHLAAASYFDSLDTPLNRALKTHVAARFGADRRVSSFFATSYATTRLCVEAVTRCGTDVTLIGLGRIEAPEDVILDRHDNLYAGSRHGDVICFFAPDYQRMEVFAHIGGQPLGMAFDRADNLYICIGGMGLYRIAPDGRVEKATDETNRSLTSVNDDSRLRLADDLDISDNGLIFFSEATIRYEMDEWPIDGLEARGNGRIICYDTNTGRTHTAVRGLKFPNGICIASDGQSILFAETFGCSVKRYWFEGPKKGAIEVVMDNLPGYPDNINLASDGNYWLALVGMRSPALDLAWRMPSFRTRMAKRVPVDEWLFPNINTGCVVKFNEKGEILDSLWDLRGVNHPMITSMREHRGYLYLGGISNNRIGRYRLEGADPHFIQYDKRWGRRA